MSTRKFNSMRKKSFSMESLEDRRLMAGDLTAQMIGGTIYLSEANGHLGEASQVVVSQLADGRIRIAGDTAHGAPSKVNGGTAADFIIGPAFFGRPSLSANLGGGNDSLRILPGVKLNAVSLNMTTTNAGVNDVDTVDIQGLKAAAAVNITTGDGVDNVFIQNSNMAGDVNIKTGKGWDYVGVGNTTNYNTIGGSLNIQTYDNLNAEADGANVDIKLTTVGHYIRSMTDNGVDNVNMLADYAGEDVVVDSQGGKDTVTMRDCTAVDQYFVLLGTGDDKLDMNYIKSNTFFADGGQGADTLVLQNQVPNNGTAFQGFEAPTNFAPRTGGTTAPKGTGTTSSTLSSDPFAGQTLASKTL